MNNRLVIKDHRIGPNSLLLSEIRGQLVLYHYMDMIGDTGYEEIVIWTDDIDRVREIVTENIDTTKKITYENSVVISENDTVLDVRYIYHWYKLSRLLRKGKKNFEKAVRWEMRTEEDIKNVETVLMRYHMYPVATRINLEIAKLFVNPLKNTKIHPNHITYVSLIFGLLACICFILVEYKYLLLGALFLQIQCTLDFADGYLARLKNLSSDFGMYLDGIVNKVVEYFSFIAIAYGLFLKTGDSIHLVIGLLVMLGFFMIRDVVNLKHGVFRKNGKIGYNRNATTYTRRSVRIIKSIYAFLEMWDIRVYIICIFAVVNRLDIAMIYFMIDFNLRWIFNVLKVIKSNKRFT